MFGYAVADVSSLSEQASSQYRSVYCGICRSIRIRYGNASGMLLSYDLTLIPLLLGGLYPAESEMHESVCPMHPFHPRPTVTGSFTDYAADMNILLMHDKLLDDWRDDKNLIKFGLARAVGRSVAQVANRYPRQATAIADCLTGLAAAEQAGDPDPDAAGHWFGVLMGEILWLYQDEWTQTLQRFGYFLGKAIYYMDAEVDLQKDLKAQRYNPFAFVDKASRLAAIEDALGNAILAYSSLPVQNNDEILENILYKGIWKKYTLKHKGESVNDKGSLSDSGHTPNGNRG